MMDDRHRMHLDRWIETATLEICREARPRIAEEIQQHYDAAFASELHTATSNTEAHQRAMLCLGDPVAAGEGFKRIYPTLFEGQKIRSFVARSRRGVAVRELWNFARFTISATLAMLVGIWLLMGFTSGWQDADIWRFGTFWQSIALLLAGNSLLFYSVANLNERGLGFTASLLIPVFGLRWSLALVGQVPHLAIFAAFAIMFHGFSELTFWQELAARTYLALVIVCPFIYNHRILFKLRDPNVQSLFLSRE